MLSVGIKSELVSQMVPGVANNPSVSEVLLGIFLIFIYLTNNGDI